MHTNLLPIARRPNLRAAFNYGHSMAGRLHVSTTPRATIRFALSRLKFRAGWPYAQRQDRRALYAGILSGLRAERRLMAAFSL